MAESSPMDSVNDLFMGLPSCLPRHDVTLNPRVGVSA